MTVRAALVSMLAAAVTARARSALGGRSKRVALSDAQLLSQDGKAI